ncbi:hypothetical protein [Novosphingobium sp.]|uniref:hypothetical protein n=1 Tax=Novosphingobium sp. TaxID=1874826 RepID=UPI00286DB41C|nr:hypothetical protein [Novosphingobium sp.]
MENKQDIDGLTIAGLALLLMSITTMVHEIGGHAAMCLATGGTVTKLGAFYATCHSPDDSTRRLVALAGPGIDAVLGLIFWQMRGRFKSDLARLVVWYCALCFSFSAAGYVLYSGISGMGDLGPGVGGGIGLLPHSGIWRFGFALGGGLAYVMLVRAGTASLTAMIGQGIGTRVTRRKIAHVFYAVLCLSAVLASLPNPVGLFVTLASALAATFGGKAGMISIGFSARTGSGAALPFRIERNWIIVLVGLAASLAFALVLGPTITLAS